MIFRSGGARDQRDRFAGGKGDDRLAELMDGSLDAESSGHNSAEAPSAIRLCR